MIEMIPNERAFYIDELKAIVVADLHIGYHHQMEEKGVVMRDNTEDMIKRIEKLLNRYDCDTLIILGDVKHSIGYERKVRILNSLNARIIIVKGNHDGGIEDMIDAEIHDASGLRLEDFGFVHGHAWPSEEVMNAKYIFMGHIHPEVELSDSTGNMHRYPCHLVGELTEKGSEIYGERRERKIIVLAAFNPMVGSAMIEDFGPLLRNGIIGNFDVYLLNGLYLGKLDDIQSLNRV